MAVARRWPIEKLKPHPDNPRRHSEEQIAMLAESLRRFGQPKAILVLQDGTIIAGHGVWQALKRIGAKDVLIEIFQGSPEDARAYMLADNQLATKAEDDPEGVRNILRDLDRSMYAALGFEDADIEALLGGAGRRGRVAEIEEIEVHDLDAQFWISVRGPLQQQAAAIDRLKAVMGEMPDIEVELGTVT